MATLERIAPFIEGSETVWGDSQTGYASWAGLFVAEANAQMEFPKCTAKKLSVRVLSNTLDGSTTITLRKNEEDTGIAFTITTGQTGLFSDTGDVLIEDGDLLTAEIDIGGTSGGIAFQGGNLVYV